MQMFNLKIYNFGRRIAAQVVLLLFLSFSLAAQSKDTSTYHILKTFPLQATFVTSDALQQWYIATAEGLLLKYNKQGQLLFEYSNDRLGTIGMIDATNPFNILVYYPDLATVILLDRTLSEIKEINLFSLAIFEPQAIALANDNNIWVYDPITAQLKKIDRTGTVLFQSKNLTQTIGTSIQPTFLIERNNQLFLSDPQQGIFIFDAFGQLQQQLPILGVEQFQISNGQLLYIQANTLNTIALNSLETTTIPLPAILTKNIYPDSTFIKQAYLSNTSLLVLRQDSVYLVRIND